MGLLRFKSQTFASVFDPISTNQPMLEAANLVQHARSSQCITYFVRMSWGSGMLNSISNRKVYQASFGQLRKVSVLRDDNW